MKGIKFLFCTVSLLFLLISCREEEVQTAPVNLNETISTLQIQFTSPQNKDTLLFSYFDEDGAGGKEPIVSTVPLSNNTDSEMLLTFLNEKASTTVIVNDELVEESDRHQVFFVPQDTILDITFCYGDSDIGNKPVGLYTFAYTKSASTGELKIVLMHELNKNDPSVQAGDISNADGTVDFEAVFDIVVQ